MLTRRSHTSERAVTLIELVVAMILMTMVVGGIVYAVTQLSSGNASMGAQRAAQRDAVEAMEQLRHDVNVARSPALELYDDRREVLRSVIAFGDDEGATGDSGPSRDACGGDTGAAYIECIQTFTTAAPNQMWFRANVDAADSTAECVGYVVAGSSLTRYVSNNWRRCGPNSVGGAVATQLIKGERSARGTRANAFAYTLRRNPALQPRGYVDPTTCATTQAANATNQRAYIASVEIDLRILTRQGKELTEGGLRTSVPVSSHTAGDYSFAVGCSA
ncbi:MAG: hypothetical protein JWM86_1653 [Thermoleophilia bacterium]|nr:hypothetical protein [Thermoleophilia bacterium]